MNNAQKKYQVYLESDHWKKKRKEAFDFYGRFCEKCGKLGTQVHHKSYFNLWKESMEDLMIVCADCHEKIHKVKPKKKKNKPPQEKEKKSAKEERKIPRQTIFSKMRKVHKDRAEKKFGVSGNDLMIKVGFGKTIEELELADFCAKMVGFDSFDPDPRKETFKFGKKRR